MEKSIVNDISSEDKALARENSVKANCKFIACLKKNKPEVRDFFIKSKNPDRILYLVAWLSFFKALTNQKLELKHLGLPDKVESGLLGEFFEKVMTARKVDVVKVVRDRSYARRIVRRITKQSPRFFFWRLICRITNQSLYPQAVNIEEVINNEVYAQTIAKAII